MSFENRLHMIGEYGEALMRNYLNTAGLPYTSEPTLPQTSRRIDYAVTAHDGTQVLVEVKTIWREPPRGMGYFNPYPPIRKHITAAARQFSKLPDTINVIALAVFPGSFVDITSPHIMLGAMYGDMAFSFPFDTTTGRGDASRGSYGFVPGKGEMVQKEGSIVKARKSRIAALLSLQANGSFWPEFDGHEELPFGQYARQALEFVSDPTRCKPQLTLWENAGAKRQVPSSLFTQASDMRWGVQGENQVPTFIGEHRQVPK